METTAQEPQVNDKFQRLFELLDSPTARWVIVSIDGTRAMQLSSEDDAGTMQLLLCAIARIAEKSGQVVRL